MVQITGSYKLSKSENFDEYMKAVGVNMVMRKLASTATPTQDITQNGDEWRIKTSTTFKTTDIKFKLGVEFDEETGDGRHCKSTITQVGDKLVHVQKVDGESLTMTRAFTDSEMVMTLEAPGNVICTRIYKRL